MHENTQGKRAVTGKGLIHVTMYIVYMPTVVYLFGIYLCVEDVRCAYRILKTNVM